VDIFEKKLLTKLRSHSIYKKIKRKSKTFMSYPPPYNPLECQNIVKQQNINEKVTKVKRTVWRTT